MSSSDPINLQLAEPCLRFQEILERELQELSVSESDHTFRQQHRATCPQCAAFAESLRLLAEILPQPEHELLPLTREVQLTLYRRQRGERIRFLALGVAGFAAALAAVVLLVLGTGQSPKPPLPSSSVAILSAARLRSGNLRLLGEMLSRGGLIPVTRPFLVSDQPAEIAIASLARLHLDPAARGTFLRASRLRSALRLDHGRVVVQVNPAAHGEFSVQAPDCTVLVKGTLFAVELQRGHTRIEVAEGVVEVRSSRWSAGPLRVAAGHSVRTSSRETTPLSTEGRRRLSSLFAEGASGTSPVPTTRAVMDAGAGTAAPRTGTAAVVTRSDARPGAGKKNDQPAHQRATVQALLEQARAHQLRRQWRSAAAVYERLIAWYGEVPAGRTALVALGEIQLDRLRQSRLALTTFQRYLTREPGGPLIPEALYGKARALRALGRAAEEKRVLQDLARRFPSYMHMPLIRQRLQRLRSP